MTDSEHSPSDDYYAREQRAPRADRPPRRREPRRLAGAGFVQQRVRLGAVVAVLVAAGFIIWVAVGGNGSSSSNSPSAPAGANIVQGTPPVALSLGGLKTLAGALHQSLYWIGTGPTATYELRQLQNGYVYVRYLPPHVAAGDPRPFLTVGTYPMQNAYSVTKGLAQGQGATAINPGHGGVAMYSKTNATDAYVAFPQSNYQIEVYSPVPRRARRFVAQGLVRPVPSGHVVSPGVSAASPARLKSVARSLGQPVYWAGPKVGTTYELTNTSSGRLYVRYLPKGLKPGAKGEYLTIGTYSVPNAYAVTSGLGHGKGSGSFRLKGGGIAAFGKSATTKDIYVAYRSEDYQVEVFDPTPGAAKKLVQSGQLVALR